MGAWPTASRARRNSAWAAHVRPGPRVARIPASRGDVIEELLGRGQRVGHPELLLGADAQLRAHAHLRRDGLVAGPGQLRADPVDALHEQPGGCQASHHVDARSRGVRSAEQPSRVPRQRPAEVREPHGGHDRPQDSRARREQQEHGHHRDPGVEHDPLTEQRGAERIGQQGHSAHQDVGGAGGDDMAGPDAPALARLAQDPRPPTSTGTNAAAQRQPRAPCRPTTRAPPGRWRRRPGRSRSSARCPPCAAGGPTRSAGPVPAPDATPAGRPSPAPAGPGRSGRCRRRRPSARGSSGTPRTHPRSAPLRPRHRR